MNFTAERLSRSLNRREPAARETNHGSAVGRTDGLGARPDAPDEGAIRDGRIDNGKLLLISRSKVNDTLGEMIGMLAFVLFFAILAMAWFLWTADAYREFAAAQERSAAARAIFVPR